MPGFFESHEQTLRHAVAAIDAPVYWSAFPEHPGAYGEDAPRDPAFVTGRFRVVGVCIEPGS